MIVCVCVCVCPCSQDPASLSLLSISDLIPDLQTIFFWMSNSIEILYFIQQRAPAYTHTIETLQGTYRVETTSHYSLWYTLDTDKATLSPHTTVYLLCPYHCHLFVGSKESLLSATISANEEAMTILEEVIMYTFQQCVYYITKVICHSGILMGGIFIMFSHIHSINTWWLTSEIVNWFLIQFYLCVCSCAHVCKGSIRSVTRFVRLQSIPSWQLWALLERRSRISWTNSQGPAGKHVYFVIWYCIVLYQIVLFKSDWLKVFIIVKMQIFWLIIYIWNLRSLSLGTNN